MRRDRHVPHAPDNLDAAQPFASSEEAWMWYAQCQINRTQGARFVGGLGLPRPCEADDIARAALTLHRRRVLAAGHLRVLGRYGLRLCPPDPRSGDPEADLRLWAEALDRLDSVLRLKGIVA